MDTLSPSSAAAGRPAAGAPLPRPWILDAPVLCADGVARCPWSLTQSEVLRDHDDAWGLRPESARGWFADLALEILQAGLAPGTALQRRTALSAAFDGFEPRHVALLDDEAIDLMLLDSTLIRNRAKLTAVVVAARSLRALETEDWLELTAPDPAEAAGSCAGDAEALVDGAAVDAAVVAGPEAPAIVGAVVGRLRAAGVIHVGPGTASRFLSRTGRAPAHVPGCYRA